MKAALKLILNVLPAILAVASVVLLAGCSTPPPWSYDPVIKSSAEGAQAAFQRGEVARADALYGRALTRARLTDNRGEIVRNAYNLALCKMIEGQLGEASNLLVQARLLTPERGLIAARVLLAESEWARLAGDGVTSGQRARQALAAGTDQEGTVQAWLLQGEAWFRAGELQGALDCFRSAKKLTRRDTPATIQARLDDLESVLVQVRSLTGSVAKLQLNRSEWLKKAGQFDEMVKALQAAATAYELESNWGLAFDCRFRAAQSLQAAGTIAQARVEAMKTVELARKTENMNNKILADNLLNEVE